MLRNGDTTRKLRITQFGHFTHPAASRIDTVCNNECGVNAAKERSVCISVYTSEAARRDVLGTRRFAGLSLTGSVSCDRSVRITQCPFSPSPVPLCLCASLSPPPPKCAWLYLNIQATRVPSSLLSFSQTFSFYTNQVLEVWYWLGYWRTLILCIYILRDQNQQFFFNSTRIHHISSTEERGIFVYVRAPYFLKWISFWV